MGRNVQAYYLTFFWLWWFKRQLAIAFVHRFHAIGARPTSTTARYIHFNNILFPEVCRCCRLKVIKIHSSCLVGDNSTLAWGHSGLRWISGFYFRLFDELNFTRFLFWFCGGEPIEINELWRLRVTHFDRAFLIKRTYCRPADSPFEILRLYGITV
jgi:hypothetical protein